MPRIAHTADVHIRALSRHIEYRHVFNAFIDDCRRQEVDHIFIGGDVFHTKTTGISPEYIDLLTWWLTEMAKVAPVHLVLGNHDGNLVNLSRQDAVTPIVEAMSNPRIHLYKKSGVYPFAPGFNFCVFSCFDEEGWKDVRPIPGDVNIATFHGPVRGSTTETGWNIDDGVTVDFFNGYDFCMLGDIHKPQAMALRDGKPWIAYPGSTIQQSYAEQIDHSYLLWHINGRESWEVVTRPLPNTNPYVTIDWTGSPEAIIATAEKFPKGSRFRIRSKSPIVQEELHRVTESLRTAQSALEVTYKFDYQVDKQLVKAGATTLAKTDLRSSDVLVKLMKDFYKEDMTPGDVTSVTEQMKTYLTAIKGMEDSSRGAKWSLRHLRWDNLFSYGEKNIIDFDKLNGIVGIFGPNRTGKSSVVGTLMYTLFNTSDRGSLKNINICNVRKAYCSGRVILDHNGTSYVIERQTTKTANKRGQVTASTALNVFRMGDDEEMEDLSGEQRSDTEKTVKSLVGLAEDFLMTSLSAQGETNQFLSQGSTKRRAVLSRLLDLDVFDMIHDVSSKDASGLKSQLKNFPERDWDDLNMRNSTNAAILSGKLSELTEKILEHQASVDLLKQDLSKHSTSIVQESDVVAQRRRVEDLKRKSEECAGSIAELGVEVESLQQKLDIVQKIVDDTDVDSLKKRLDTQKKLEASIVELRHAHERESVLLTSQRKSLKILDEVPCGDDYPTCKFIKDAHDNKQVVTQQELKAQKALKVLEEARSVLVSQQDDTLPDRISKYDKALGLVDKLKLEISRKETEIERLRSNCDSCLTTLKEAEKKLKTLESALDNEENEEAVTIRSRIKELSEEVRKLDADKLDVAAQMGKLKAVMEQLSIEKKSRDELLTTYRTHDLIATAFAKRGIPLLVTKSQLPVINAEVAKILQGIVDFVVELEIDDETDALEIYIDYGDSRRIIELCSGMEKTIAAIALRVAMVNVSSLPKSDFFIIDEGFGTLDSAGVEACSRFLTSLKRHFKTVVVITHVDGIKDAADHVLEITKSEKDSKLEYA